MASGRPPKVGGSRAVPVNVRMSVEDHGVLADMASRLRIPGCPPPTVQEILRRLVRGGISEPDTMVRLIIRGQL